MLWYIRYFDNSMCMVQAFLLRWKFRFYPEYECFTEFLLFYHVFCLLYSSPSNCTYLTIQVSHSNILSLLNVLCVTRMLLNCIMTYISISRYGFKVWMTISGELEAFSYFLWHCMGDWLNLRSVVVYNYEFCVLMRLPC